MFGDRSKQARRGSNTVETLIGPRVTIHYQAVEMAAGAMITGRLIHPDVPMAQLTAPAAVAAESADSPEFMPVRA